MPFANLMIWLFGQDNSGLRVCFAMFFVGLIFLGVIALGELFEASHRRRARSSADPGQSS